MTTSALFRSPVPPNWGRKSFAGDVKLGLVPPTPYDAASLADVSSTPGNIIMCEPTFQPANVNAKLELGTLIPYNDTDAMFNRQTLGYSEYDFTAWDWIAVAGSPDGITSTFWLADQAPNEIAPILSRTIYALIAMDPIIVSASVTDFEGDAVTLTGFSCPGCTLGPQVIGGQNVIAITGTPTTPGVYVQHLIATDDPGAATALTAFTLTVASLIAVPDVDNGDTPLAAAGAAITAAGLLVSGQPILVNTAVTAGNVDHTTPPGGTLVNAGAPVVLYVSADPAPDETGALQSTAVAVWAAFPATVVTAFGASDTVPFGHVISQTDANGFLIGAGQLYLPGQVVNLLISSATLVPAPSVAGDLVADAITQIEAVPAVVGYGQPQYSETIGINRVISQSPLAGVPISSGDTITIVVSLGSVKGSAGGSLNYRSDYGLLRLDRGPADYVKGLAESIYVEFPWASKLNGETIVTVAYAFPDGLANEAQSGTTSMRQVLVSGGRVRGIYRVISTVTTSGGRTLEWTKRVLVDEGNL